MRQLPAIALFLLLVGCAREPAPTPAPGPQPQPKLTATPNLEPTGNPKGPDVSKPSEPVSAGEKKACEALLKATWRPTIYETNPDKPVVGLFSLGVTFDETTASLLNEMKHLRELNCSNTKFKPGALKLLKNHPTLEKLGLLGDVDPTVMPELPDGPPIKELSLSKVEYTPALFEIIAKMPALTSIEVGQGLPGTAVLRPLHKMKNLESLDMSASEPPVINDLLGFPNLKRLSCKVPKSTEAYFDDLVKLKGLQSLTLYVPLEGNKPPTTPAGLAKLAALTGLQELDLRCPIGEENFKAFAPLKNLEVLNIYSDGVTDDGMKTLRGFPKLTSLSIQLLNSDFKRSKQVLSEAAFAELKGLTGLKTLRLPAANLPEGGAAVIGSLTNLEFLELTSVKPDGDKIAPSLANLTKLRYLDLQSSGLTDAGLKQLAGLKDLTELRIGANKVTPAGVEALQKALPKAKIVSAGVF